METEETTKNIGSEYLEKIKKGEVDGWGIDGKAIFHPHQNPCPRCGYCPHCGRGGHQDYWRPHWGYYPYYYGHL